jgi:hypothetical protein
MKYRIAKKIWKSASYVGNEITLTRRKASQVIDSLNLITVRLRRVAKRPGFVGHGSWESELLTLLGE